MTDAVETIEQFLDQYDSAMEDYERGYTDADATLRLVDSHVDQLRDMAD